MYGMGGAQAAHLFAPDKKIQGLNAPRVRESAQ